MSAPFARNALSSQISGLTAAVAMAIGGMVTTLEASASATSVHGSRHEALSEMELQRRAKAQQAAAAAEAYLKVLNEVIERVHQLEFIPENIGYQEWNTRAEMIRSIESTLDAQLVNLRMGGRALDEDTRQARKAIGLVRIKIDHITSTIRRLKDEGESFESDIDLQGFYALADARTENVGKRFH